MEEKRGRLRVLSANLWRGRADPDALGRRIEELDVDVMAVQELSARQVGVISELLPHGKLEPTAECEGMGIALRHPGKVERLLLRHRDAQAAELVPGEWPGLSAPIELMNVHIQAPHGFPQWRSLARRRDQIRVLDTYLRNVPKRRVVVGDFNENASGDAIELLESRGLKTALPEFNPSATTWRWWGW